MKDIMIVGFGGHALSIVDTIMRSGDYSIAGYTDFKEHKSSLKYLGTDDCLETIFASGITNAIVGVGYLGKGEVRNRLYEKLKKIGYELPIICDPSAIVSMTATIGEGSFIGKNVVINNGASVGKMAIINTNALIEHECRIGDFTHVAVSAVLCGGVTVGDMAFIGANSTIIQGMEIERKMIIPAGEVVRKSVRGGGSRVRSKL